MGASAAEQARALASQFDRMVQRDGGDLSLLGVAHGVVRFVYRPGLDAACETDACVLPHAELQQLMTETLARRDASLRVVVELVD